MCLKDGRVAHLTAFCFRWQHGRLLPHRLEVPLLKNSPAVRTPSSSEARSGVREIYRYSARSVEACRGIEAPKVNNA